MLHSTSLSLRPQATSTATSSIHSFRRSSYSSSSPISSNCIVSPKHQYSTAINYESAQHHNITSNNTSWTKLKTNSGSGSNPLIACTSTVAPSSRVYKGQHHPNSPTFSENTGIGVGAVACRDRSECSLILDELGRPPLLKLLSSSDTLSKSRSYPIQSIHCESISNPQENNHGKKRIESYSETIIGSPPSQEKIVSASDNDFLPSPSTPLPAESHPSIDNDHFSMLSMTLSTQHDVDKNIPQTRSATLPDFGSKQVQVSTNHPPTPRIKPKPTPIATKLPSRSSSMLSMDDNFGQDINTNGLQSSHTPISFQMNECYSPASAESNEFCGRDSGIALESWDNPRQEWEKSPKKEQFPTFDQLFQPQFDLLDPFKSNFGQKSERRQRCQSMVCPKSSREIEIDFVSPESEQKQQRNLTSTSEPKPKCKTRPKRVSSMSIGSNTINPKNPTLFSHDLPPLPPKTNVAPTASRNSFFAPPSQNESWMDNDQSRLQQNSSISSNSFSSSSSSSSSSATSATLSLPRLPSNPESSASLSRGIEFSNILDLATAKAENITGLYFAKQLNRKSTSLSSLNTSLDPTYGTPNDNASIPSSSKSRPEQLDATPVKIEIDAPSPILANIPPPSNTDSLEILTRDSSLGSLNLDTKSNPTKDESLGVAPSTPTRGQHRRSHSASHFFRLSSQKHHSPAQFNLALCYEHGQGGEERDLKKALYFYQQAADQGHTKASYNIGCICYNQGEVSKAMVWFERAGKCRIRGLVLDENGSDEDSSQYSQENAMQFPLPRGTILPHGLEDILLGDKQSTSGPFAAYLPAILCLALLCRQGVQTRDGKTILMKDTDQSVELLQVLLQRASRLPSCKEKERQEPIHSVTHDPLRDCHSVEGSSRLKSSAQTELNQQGHGHLSSLLSASCPSLPLGVQSEKLQCDSNFDDSISSTSSNAMRKKVKRRSTVQDETEVETPLDKMTFFAGANTHELDLSPNNSSLDQQESDDHESWSITLAEQLIKFWKPTMGGDAVNDTEVEKRNSRVLRHHLLYITNPTLSKNLYNLGVLYDLHLGNPVIAVKCYRSAYQQELPAEEFQQRSRFVTRINSAWNLGVLHVRRKEWKLAREWFLRGQQDIRLYEREGQKSEKSPIRGQGGVEFDQSDTLPIDLNNNKDNNNNSPTRIRGPKRSLVNVIPQTRIPQVTDSPGRKHAQQHGLMMCLNTISTKMNSNANEQQLLNKRSNEQRKINSTEDGIRTDSGKIAWVLRWVESNLS